MSNVHLKGVFGALRDAAPDYWGRRVIEKHAGKTNLGEMDYLLESPDDRAGALGFGLGNVPPAPQKKFNKTLGPRASSIGLKQARKVLDLRGALTFPWAAQS